MPPSSQRMTSLIVLKNIYSTPYAREPRDCAQIARPRTLYRSKANLGNPLFRGSPPVRKPPISPEWIVYRRSTQTGLLTENPARDLSTLRCRDPVIRAILIRGRILLKDLVPVAALPMCVYPIT